jgi:hypothetical protein
MRLLWHDGLKREILILYRDPSTPFRLPLHPGQLSICILAEEEFALNDAFNSARRTGKVKSISVLFDVSIIVASAIATFTWWPVVIETAEEKCDYDAEYCENGERQEANQRAINQCVTEAVVEEYSTRERHDEWRGEKHRRDGVEFDAHVGLCRCRTTA